MTVQYYENVLTGGPVVFFRLLAKWRGCVFKLIYMDLAVFLTGYYILSFIYRFGLNSEQQRSFERVVQQIYSFQSLIPVAFILGFYVTLVFNRFWSHFLMIPWSMKFATMLAAYLPGSSDKLRLMRRTMIRYMNSALVLTATRLHSSAKKRFPTSQHIVDAGILNANEMMILEDIQPFHTQPFIPIAWAVSIITRAEREKLIINYHALVNMINEINRFRQGLLKLFLMDYVSVPLVYTQVVTLAVYTYFLTCLVGRQFIMDSSPNSTPENRDMYIPVFTILEFIVYMGWLKVAETLVNPMGEDDEDFDVNEIIDYNWKVSLSLVDDVKHEPPHLVRDAHWNVSQVTLPHTDLSKRFVVRPFMGSVSDLNVVGPHQGSLQSLSIAPTQMEMMTSHQPQSEIHDQSRIHREVLSRRPSRLSSVISLMKEPINEEETDLTENIDEMDIRSKPSDPISIRYKREGSEDLQSQRSSSSSMPEINRFGRFKEFDYRNNPVSEEDEEEEEEVFRS